MVKADPPVRRNGRCALPGCAKRLAAPKRRQKGVDPALYEREPFCSAVCARLYHGVDVPTGAVAKTTCSGCGTRLDTQTPGCKACSSRHASREKARVAA